MRHAHQGIGMFKVEHVALSLHDALGLRHGSGSFSNAQIHHDCTAEYPWKPPAPLTPYTSAPLPCNGYIAAKMVRFQLPINQRRNQVWHRRAHESQTK